MKKFAKICSRIVEKLLPDAFLFAIILTAITYIMSLIFTDATLFPLTGKGVVDYIVTELAFIEVTSEGLVLKEIAEGITLDKLRAKTGAKLIVAEDLKVMEV